MLKKSLDHFLISAYMSEVAMKCYYSDKNTGSGSTRTLDGSMRPLEQNLLFVKCTLTECQYQGGECFSCLAEV